MAIDLGGMGADLSAFGTRIDALGRYASESRREARQGIAAAMTMVAAPMPSAAGRTSWSVNSATFQGEWAGGVAIAHRLDISMPVALTAGVSTNSGRAMGVRLGVSGEF